MTKIARITETYDYACMVCCAHLAACDVCEGRSERLPKSNDLCVVVGSAYAGTFVLSESGRTFNSFIEALSA